MSTQLALAAALAFVQGGEDADGREEAGGDVAQREAGPHGRAARLAGDAHDAAHALDDDVEGGLVAVGAGLAEAGGGGVDEARVAGGERLVAEAEAVHGARREVLHHDVDLLDQAQEEVLALRLLEVEQDALLAAVDAEEVGCSRR